MCNKEKQNSASRRQVGGCRKRNFFKNTAKTIHDFANRTNEKCGLLNFFIPGGFERNMSSIVKWFEDNQS